VLTSECSRPRRHKRVIIRQLRILRWTRPRAQSGHYGWFRQSRNRGGVCGGVLHSPRRHIPRSARHRHGRACAVPGRPRALGWGRLVIILQDAACLGARRQRDSPPAVGSPARPTRCRCGSLILAPDLSPAVAARIQPSPHIRMCAATASLAALHGTYI
jgi:hypothetical protein